MKKILLVVFSLLFASYSYAQQGVSLNDSGTPADPSAMLDVSSASKGLLIPRVALNSINDITTIANPATSLLVFNNNAAMIGGGVGFWYFNGTIWVQAIGPQGVQGPIGPTGPQGLQGVQGAIGVTGPQGIQGTVGATGPQGLQGVQGAIGATGPQGLQGVQGITGPQGIQGYTGPQGVQGATGPQGIQGAAGATGATGVPGPVGCGTANYVVKSDGTAATCSQIFDDGTTVGIGINTSLNPTSKLHIYKTGALAELTLQSNGHDGPTAGGRIIFNNDVLNNSQGNITFVNDGFGSSVMSMGVTYFSNAMTINGDGPFASRNSNLAIGTTLFVNDVENGTVVNKVGIGTNTPQNSLDVSNANGRGVAIGSYAGINAAPSGGLIASGNVGIGTTNPGAKLEVAGQVKITGGAPAAGKVLTSDDATGLASWQTPSGGTISGSGTQNYLARWINTNTLGNGVTYDNGTNVGIGTANPSKRLHIYQSGALAEMVLQSNGHDNAYAGGKISFYNDDGGAQGNITYVNNGYGSNYMSMGINYFSNAITINGVGPSYNQNSNLAVGTTLYVQDFENGTAVNQVGIGVTNPGYQLHLSTDGAAKTTTSVWITTSDARLKTNIIDYNEGLSSIMKIHPVWFTFTGEAGMPKDTGVGILAQELQEIAPYMVGSWTYTNKDGKSTDYLNVNNGPMTYMLINSVKELKAQLDQLNSKNETLQAELNEIKRMLNIQGQK